jgi:hypothetical protein
VRALFVGRMPNRSLLLTMGVKDAFVLVAPSPPPSPSVVIPSPPAGSMSVRVRNSRAGACWSYGWLGLRLAAMAMVGVEGGEAWSVDCAALNAP